MNVQRVPSYIVHGEVNINVQDSAHSSDATRPPARAATTTGAVRGGIAAKTPDVTASSIVAFFREGAIRTCRLWRMGVTLTRWHPFGDVHPRLFFIARMLAFTSSIGDEETGL